jgi:DNA (cytosine-5)-methyltransferase 1
MTTLPDRIRSGEVEAPNLFCGGTPCQAFSVAGLRRSLDDARGNLSLTFCEIADAIDSVRRAAGKPASIIFWENVPGVLSTADNAFGCFLGALAGCDSPVFLGGRWTDAGVVAGPQRTVAWRILDAQYFGLAQRRRRVFVVASARDGFDPASVLFEWEGLRRDSAPSREARQGTTRGASAGAGSGIDFQNAALSGDLAGTLDAEGQKRGNRGHGILAFGGGQNCAQTDVSTSLSAHPGGSRLDFQTETFVTHSLRGEGFDASEDGTGRGTPLVPVAFHPTQDPISSTDVCHAIGTGNGQGCATAAVALRGRDGGATAELGDDAAFALRASSGGGDKPHVLAAMQVRRLTPRECERLQGFPDNYTAIPWRGKPADQCPDGPRYKALGNSWAVPVVRWIGRRIAAALPT